MKNPARVAALLAELRTLAETDFERHRIDVLERDLTSPPKVEVVDDKTQKFGNVSYRVTQDKHYRGNRYIHQSVWEYFYGEVPAGCVVHHIDGNPSNNSPENLQCLSNRAHNDLHNATRQKAKLVCEVCGREYEGFATGRNKFCSSQCANSVRNKRMEKEKVCSVCGQKFKSRRANAKFCSPTCRGENNRTPELKKTCPFCGKEFALDKKHKAQIYCSLSCAKKAEHAKKRKFETCIICGKEFLARPGVQTCSHECGAKLMWQRRRETKS